MEGCVRGPEERLFSLPFWGLLLPWLVAVLLVLSWRVAPVTLPSDPLPSVGMPCAHSHDHDQQGSRWMTGAPSSIPLVNIISRNNEQKTMAINKTRTLHILKTIHVRPLESRSSGPLTFDSYSFLKVNTSSSVFSLYFFSFSSACSSVFMASTRRILASVESLLCEEASTFALTACKTSNINRDLHHWPWSNLRKPVPMWCDALTMFNKLLRAHLASPIVWMLFQRNLFFSSGKSITFSKFGVNLEPRDPATYPTLTPPFPQSPDTPLVPPPPQDCIPWSASTNFCWISEICTFL